MPRARRTTLVPLPNKGDGNCARCWSQRRGARWTIIAIGMHDAFDRLVPSLGKGTASVAMARTLLVVVWHVLTDQVADRHAAVAMVTRQLQRWGKSPR